MDLLTILPQAVDARAIFDSCEPGHFLDCVQDVFLLMAEGWMQRAINIARVIFLALAALELAVSGWVYWTRRSAHGSGDVIGTLAVKLGTLAFILGVLTSYSWWVPAIPYALGETASEIGGAEVAELSVTGLAYRGWEIGILHIARPSLTGKVFGESWRKFDLFRGFGLGMVFSIQAALTDLMTSIILMALASIINVAVGLFVCFMFIRIAILLLIALLEAYLAIGGGILFVGMLAFRGTAPLFSGWLSYLVHVSVRLFFLILIAGAALSIGTAISEIIASGNIPDGLDLSQGGASSGAFVGTIGVARMGFALGVAAIVFLLYSLARVLPDRIARQISSFTQFDAKKFLSR